MSAWQRWSRRNWDAYRQEAVEYNEKLAGSNAVLTDAFTQNDAEGQGGDPEYDGILDMEESGVMGAIEIRISMCICPFITAHRRMC